MKNTIFSFNLEIKFNQNNIFQKILKLYYLYQSTENLKKINFKYLKNIRDLIYN